MTDLKWWGSLCLAFMLALPMGMAQADDDDDDDRWEERDEDDRKSRKKGRDDDDDDDEEEGEIELDSVRYQAKKNLIRIKGELDDFDGRTEVVVSESAFGTELAGKRVKEEFNFKIELADGQPVPCAVVVTAGDVSVTAAVRKAPSTCDKFTKTISGIVTDGPIPFATVSVTIDGVTYTTTADELGQYALQIATASVGDLVKVEASGTDPETGTPIEFVNFAGSFERVLDDEPQNVTNVTTASFVLAVEANGGTEPTTLEELKAAETAIDATELFQLAAVIKLLVDDPAYTLPAGFDNVLDFASDSNAVNDFVATADPADLDQALADILADSNLVEGFVAAEIPSRYFAVPTANPGFLARQGQIFEFDQGTKTGTILGFDGFSGLAIEETFDWRVDESGRLVIEYTAPVVQTSFFTIEETGATQDQINQYIAGGGLPGNRDIVAEIATVQSKFTRVVDGSLVDVTSREDVQRTTFPTLVLNNGDTLDLDPIEEIDTGNENLRDGNDVITFPLVADCAAAAADEVCVPGRWGATYRYAPGNRFFDGYEYPASNWGDVLTFESNGIVSGIVSGVDSSWTVEGGSLVIIYDDSTRQKITVVDNIGLEYGVLNEYEGPDGRLATYDIWVKADAPFEFTESYLENPPGKYWNGDINTWIPGYFDEDGNRNLISFFGWSFDAQTAGPNTGENLFLWVFDENGDGSDDNVLTRRPNNWELEPGRLKIDRFLIDCCTSIDRFWYPIAATTDKGDRVTYVMEVEFRFGGLLFPARINIERELDLRDDFDADITIDVP